MPLSPARAAAFDILLRVLRDRAYAGELLHSSRLHKLSPQDRALCTELVMGVLRWQSRLDAVLTQRSSRPLEKLDAEVLLALRMAAYQIGFLARVPASAAVNDSVELVKRAHKSSAAGFTNALLRKLSPRPLGEAAVVSPVADAAELSHLYAHPLWMVARWRERLGPGSAGEVCDYDQRVPPTALRLAPGAEAELAADGIALAPGALLAAARIVASGDVTRTAAFREGRVAIQDEASQLVALLVGRGARLLDCCAAPGGKTAILAERNPRAEIVAAELHPRRADLLRRRLAARNVQVIAADARSLPLAPAFDRILADVPCSGTGTLARHPEIKWRLQPQDLAPLQSLQFAILDSVARLLAPGGRLVYSTCSLEAEENEAVVERVLGSHPCLRLLDCREELLRLREEGELMARDLDSLLRGGFLRILPGAHRSDGFFAALLERSA